MMVYISRTRVLVGCSIPMLTFVQTDSQLILLPARNSAKSAFQVGAHIGLSVTPLKKMSESFESAQWKSAELHLRK